MAKRQQVSGPRSGTQLRPTARPIETFSRQEQPAIEFGGSRGDNIKSAVDSINKKVLQPAIAREQEKINVGQASEVYEINSFLDAKMEEAATLRGGSNGDMNKGQAIQQYQGFVNEALSNRAGGVQKLFARIAGKKAFEVNGTLDTFYTEQGYDNATRSMLESMGNELKGLGVSSKIPTEDNFNNIANIGAGAFELFYERMGGRVKGEELLVALADSQSLAGDYSLLPLLKRKNESTGGTIAGKAAHAKKVAQIEARYLKDKEDFQTLQQKESLVSGYVGQLRRGETALIVDMTLADGTTFSESKIIKAVGDALEKDIDANKPPQVLDKDGQVDPEKKIKYLNDTFYGKYAIENPKWTTTLQVGANALGELGRKGADEKMRPALIKQATTAYALYKVLRSSGANREVLGTRITDDTERKLSAIGVSIDVMGKNMEEAAMDISSFQKSTPVINVVKWADDEFFLKSNVVSGSWTTFGDGEIANVNTVLNDYNSFANYILGSTGGSIDAAKESAMEYIDRAYVQINTPDGNHIAVKTQPLDNIKPETFEAVLQYVAQDDHLAEDDAIHIKRLTDTLYGITVDGLSVGRTISVNQLKQFQIGNTKAVNEALFGGVREVLNGK